jgi:glycosyltransferase involved in cell wall biosynthesis
MGQSATNPKSDNTSAAVLSVVIPHFNHGSIIPRAIASVLGNNFPGIEIIVVDDGSTDGSKAVLDAIELTRPEVRIVYTRENRGAPAALNTGLGEARGRYITFLGADDFVLPELYRTIISALGSNVSAAFACTRIATVDVTGRVTGIRPFAAPVWREKFLSPKEVAKHIRSTDNWICNTTAVYRADMLRNAGGFDVSLGAFCDGFVTRELAFTHGFVFLPGVFGVWQVAAESLSARSILDREEAERLIDLGRTGLAASPVGRIASDYPETFVRRLRFSGARMHLVWHGRSADPEVIASLAGGNAVDRKVLVAIRRALGLRRLGRILTLGWLAARLRPMTLTALVLNSVRNKFVMRRNKARLEKALIDLTIAQRKLMSDPTLSQDAEIKRPRSYAAPLDFS